ncbi:M13 family metallopeptidase [Massilia glaciei]|uniref:M13 family peptidase n=1 Tax=Massilia glaciei TaxID=1524097 RepID=A0A2U2I7E0_9BURK|nr:M13 family metallopeptidase [Massilia glaciei]PWF55662.1 M13 family peptidase [Massilia glaciei]
MKRYLLSTLTLSLMAAFATATPTSGIEMQYVDPSVRVQDDFFGYVNGKWLKTTEIPADKPSYGTGAMVNDAIQPQVRAIIEAARDDKKAGPEARKIGDMYASYMDEAKRAQLGYKPLAGELAKIRGMKDKKALPALMSRLSMIGVATPFGMRVGQDARESTRYAAYLGQRGLGLPDRDYYLKDEARMVDIRAKYLKHMETILGMVGRADAAKAAADIMAFETELAKVQWSRVENRDPVKRYNKMTIAKLAETAPGFDWKAAADAAGMGKADYVIVAQPTYMTGMSRAIDQAELATLKSYLEWQLVRAYAPYLSKPFVDENFAFYRTTLNGVAQNLPLWKRAVAGVEDALGEAVGKQYVTQHFPAERKARMDTLVKNLVEAYRQSIETLEWMGPETKKEAQAKLAKFTPKIGYPNKWRDYTTLAIKPNDLVGNMMRASTFDYKRGLAKLGKPIDREEWGMTPQTVNAYYSSTMNEIVFPAAILQPPYFDMRADDAVNYGAIGAVIGHEIGHGFDDSGSQSDGDGNLRDWWTAQDRARFKERTQMLVKQYSAYSPLPGYNVNGQLGLGENIGDNSGIFIAHKAYQISLGGKPAPVIDGLTGDQRFFMGWAQVWRIKMRDEAMINQLKVGPHSPGMYRASGAVINHPAFHEAFGIKEGDKMYVAPKDRVSIW